MAKATFVYVTYIRTTPQELWAALTTDTEFQREYWFGVHCESEWKPGSSWTMIHSNGSISDAGEIIEADAPRRLVIKWRHKLHADMTAEGDSLCTMELEPVGDAVKLSINHSIDREHSKLITAVSGGWPKILSNLKSLMENGAVAVKGQ